MQTKELKSNITKRKDAQKNIQSESKSFVNIRDQIKSKEKFGKWTTTDKWKKRGSSWYLKCLCDCGLENDVLAYDLIRGSSIQCRSCRATQNNLKHGQNCHGKISYEYHYWQNLKTKKLLDDNWSKSFELFFKDLGKRPEEGFILLRKNYNFLHSLSNTYWGHPKLKFFKDLQGKKIGEWIILEKDLISKRTRWLCQCSCGSKDYIPQSNLINNKSTKCKSCAMKGKNLKKHGHSKTSVYRIFHGIKARCYNQKNKNYIHYGGRGIKICESWLDSIDNFVNDMGPRPSSEHSIDRIDVNGDYSPKNCKWSLQKEQVSNRRKVGDLQKQIEELKLRLSKYEEV